MIILVIKGDFMLSFSFQIEKKHRGDMTIAKGHNLREHPTASQLPDAAWFTQRPKYTIITWDNDRVRYANSLAKRKDAVIGIELFFQVGRQQDWRKMPTKDFPWGKPKDPKDWPADLHKMAIDISDFLNAVFGEQNIISLELHLDESTPHYHAVVIPVSIENKLQSKCWLNGPAAMGRLYAKAHQFVSKSVPCTYTPRSRRGGKPHDPGKAAGQAEIPGLLDKLTQYKAMLIENKALRKRVSELEKVVFTHEKTRYSAAKLRQAERILENAINDADKTHKQKIQNEQERVELAKLRAALNQEKSYEQTATGLLIQKEKLEAKLQHAHELIKSLEHELNQLRRLQPPSPDDFGIE
ncbi:plasmid recombination protein [Burkholderiaceae bacterium DAT-1]|nr:plasmid recombination protein [Burkholderiaceae bacterium DAT-1]